MRPSPRPLATYVERARALAPRIEARRDEIERQRRLPDDVVAALTEAGFFRLLLPRSWEVRSSIPSPSCR